MKTKRESNKVGAECFHLIVVGTGGTGSEFIPAMMRFLAANEDLQRRVVITLVDGDYVEKKNLTRQNFILEDIGRNKAEVMAEAVQDTFGLECIAHTEYVETEKQLELIENAGNKVIYERFHNSNWKGIPVYIGCVDNVSCRRLLENWFRKKKNQDIVYYDSGNGFSNGQTIYAAKWRGVTIAPSSSLYGIRYEGEERRRSEISCEELNRVEPQHQLTNRLAAQCLLAGAQKLLTDGTVMGGITTFDALECRMQHVSCKKLMGWMPHKVEEREKQ